jgi:small subunit ribosomal protein S1
MQLDEPIEVKIYEWNTGGLLTKIEVRQQISPFLLLMYDVPYDHKLYCFSSRVMYSSTSLQGLRAFLPKFELMDRISTFLDLKTKVGNFGMLLLLLPKMPFWYCFFFCITFMLAIHIMYL